jgi:hypothetical protein
VLASTPGVYETNFIVDFGSWYNLSSLFSTFKPIAGGGTPNVVIMVNEHNVSGSSVGWTEVYNSNQVYGTQVTANENNGGAGWENVRYVKFRFRVTDAAVTDTNVINVYTCFGAT